MRIPPLPAPSSPPRHCTRSHLFCARVDEGWRACAYPPLPWWGDGQVRFGWTCARGVRAHLCLHADGGPCTPAALAVLCSDLSLACLVGCYGVLCRSYGRGPGPPTGLCWYTAMRCVKQGLLQGAGWAYMGLLYGASPTPHLAGRVIYGWLFRGLIEDLHMWQQGILGGIGEPFALHLQLMLQWGKGHGGHSSSQQPPQ